jgi:hypothetical protein
LKQKCIREEMARYKLFIPARPKKFMGEFIGSFLMLWNDAGKCVDDRQNLKQMTTITQKRLRVVLQDRTSLLYVRSENQWTAELDEAADFGELRKAHEYAQQMGHPNLNMVMTFDGERKHAVQIYPRDMPG